MTENLSRQQHPGEDFEGRDLHGASLAHGNFAGANFRRADLSKALLTGADLTGTDFRGANLHEAVLSRANLSGADFRGAYLWGASLREANLTAARLDPAWLTNASLRHANLTGATLKGAAVAGADISHARFGLSPGVPLDLLGAKRSKRTTIRMSELSRELGISPSETLELLRTLGVDVQSTRDWVDEAHADRVHRWTAANPQWTHVRPGDIDLGDPDSGEIGIGDATDQNPA